MGLQVVWFKRDLRLDDHVPLAEAAQQTSTLGPVLPLYVAEPEIWGGEDMSGRHWAFAGECLEELRAALAGIGQPLVIRHGEIVSVLEDLHRRYGLTRLWSHQETGNAATYARDKRVLAWTRARGIPWRELRQHGIVRGLASRDGWARRWDRFMAEPIPPAPTALQPLSDIAPGSLPTASDLGLAPDPCPERQLGGRRAGLEVLESFLTERGRTYRRAMSSPVTGFHACSRLSSHFAWGSVSLREASQAAKRELRRQREADRTAEGWCGSLSSFVGRLHWHCHFMQKLEDGPEIEFDNLHPAYDALDKPLDMARFQAWCGGRTGLPFVDACMRALLATGWMNFRMRAMLMAVASYHLWLPWRPTGLHLARLFTDYEAGIHWPQTQMQSGTTGINTVRIYNPVKQGYDQDPDGRFVKRWVPELAAVPQSHIHEPWSWDRAGQLDYPAPIVDHKAAAQSARAAIRDLRKSDAFQRNAEAIQAKHGSRRSGLSQTNRRGRRSSGSDARQREMKL
ncbi:FAD-binding domain-containing protein [Algihabitans albus]|uniref:FAD-binding domain-containing protein n=1 Tax=Algihabitans albus TaxID=2164067 RepID=UPI000E5C9ABC|nr:FAD-binding domain-containing protein [Algihabitans albus]